MDIGLSQQDVHLVLTWLANAVLRLWQCRTVLT